ncbi:MAG: protein-L-isoaspartate O-methyltransferase [Rhodospirillales bacterium]|nr:MAG: protein-L-isoaspartate O-methyltransferase [Rhodospirillales bacterium]
MDHAARRRRMVDSQLRTNQINDPAVLAAMARIPREAFVPPALKQLAYIDEDLDLGNGRFLMEPLVLARLLQAAEIGPEAVILNVGAGPGYDAAVMAQIGSTVIALESDPALAAAAAGTLADLGVDNVVVVEQPLDRGYPRGGPYDVIVFGGAVADIPDAVQDQLAEHGRLVAVVLDRGRVGKVVAVTRVRASFARRQVFDAFTPILPGFAPVPRFTF